MYGWIWRKLPFGLYGKLTGSVLLVSLVGALLWFFVFPAIEPAVTPFDDVQVGDPGTGPTFNPDDHAVPYETNEPGTPSPTPSKRR